MPGRPGHSRTVRVCPGDAASRQASKGSRTPGSTTTCAPKRPASSRRRGDGSDTTTGATAPLDERRGRAVHAWRATFERDPRLPGALLPADWPGFTATRLFVDTWRAVRGPADRRWAHLAEDPRG
ncbi:PaaX family transcriptional regulator C-terminal domain-containing protein [Streptomyces sp. NPDC086554]|uniref:PaaX family transcriptional regulator C-terminal domain-containing protein n=1 Tax=Streptomyces sp. NPDC086554 TaxID=3154864 RepID=UPI00342E4F3F